MSRYVSAVVAVGAVLLSTGVLNAEPRQPPQTPARASVEGKCARDPNLVGACSWVRGRLGAYNGNPTYRMWKVGTDRLLGVSASRPAGGGPVLPDVLEEILEGGYPVLADYLVCPFTEERKGEMQLICVEEAKNIRLGAWRLW